MRKYKPLFGTGLARSGGGLYSMCLSTHPNIMLACCPNLEIFRSYRNAVIKQHAPAPLQSIVPPNAPLQDYYYTEQRIQLLDVQLNSDLNLAFRTAEWPEFHDTSVARGNLESRDLTQHFAKIKGKTYQSMFDNLLNIIAQAREAQRRTWVGFHEAWIIDSYPALARAYPDARFIIMLRDPRAIVNSMLGVKNIDPTQVAQILSYIRHWRKYVALALHYQQDPLFNQRLFITSHDALLQTPETTVRAICHFLDVYFDERLLDTDNYIDYATGNTWTGNSSFESTTSGISAHRTTRWKQKLHNTVVKTIEYLCGAEMLLCGYEPFTHFAASNSAMDEDILQVLMNDHAFRANWRSDLGDPLQDIGAELLRRQLLASDETIDDTHLIRRCFLFEHVYTTLRSAKQVFNL